MVGKGEVPTAYYASFWCIKLTSTYLGAFVIRDVTDRSAVFCCSHIKT